MLRFILGCAGTGKTALLLERLGDAARRGESAVLLVPEQYSFTGEQTVRRVLGPRLALGVEVLSFTRLCNGVFRAHGGLAGITLTETGRYLLMSLAVDELKSGLKVYRKSCQNPSFLQTLVTVCQEFKSAGLTPERLENVAKSCQSGPLRDKLYDLGALYAAYQALLERGYSDPDDDLTRACQMLSEHNCFAGKKIFVDGFTTFMAAEFELLRRLLAQADEVTFAMTADGIGDAEQGMGVFSTAKAAMRRLISGARACGVPVDSPVVLREPHRFKNDELTLISRQFLLPGGEVFEDDPKAVVLHQAADIYREVEYVAAKIANLTREEGLRYRDIAVVARETGPYLRALESVFIRAGLPYFVDDTRDAETTPLMGGLLAAVEAVRGNFATDAVLTYAKSPVAGLDAEDVAALENYCYCWDIRGRLWENELRGNPRGLAGALTEDDAAVLEAVNRTRKAVAAPLLKLEENLRGCNGRGFARGIYDFLQEIGAPRNLMDFAGALPGGRRETFLDESAQLWDMLMEVLDIFGAVLGAATLPVSRFCELLRLSLASARLGLVPQTLDEVLVGKADRIRPGEVRAVFVVGAAEGLFPPDCAPGGVFTDNERRKMIELGAEIGAPSLNRAVLEKFFCYSALTMASERLTVTMPRAKTNGQEYLPSVIITQLKALFPRLAPHRPDEDELICGAGAAFDLLARHYREDTPRTAALLDFFADGKTPALRRMQAAACKPVREIEDKAVARELFGGKMALSPSKVERYHRCAFSYFVQDGLKLRRRARVDFSPLESGSVIHHVLQVMAQRHGAALSELSNRAMAAQIREIIGGYIAERAERQENLPARFQYLFERLTGTLVHLLRRLGEEFAQSDYIPAAFEMPINRREGVPPLELRTAGGTAVMVEGTVDRVDIMDRGDNRYLRVVDYKSGGKEFRLDDVLCGLNLQMLLYLFTIAENGGGALKGRIPAGVLYMPANASHISAGRNTGKDAVAGERQKQWRMSGLLLDDEESLRGMERGLKGVFIPVKAGKDGLDKRSALAGKADMGRLCRKVKKLIAQMAESLSQGEIPALPLCSAGFDPCEFCDCAALCGFEPGDAARAVAKMDRAEALEALMEEADG